MELGARIKEARLAAGLSQRQLCGQVCTRNMLSLIESGKAKPSMETLRHFANRLGRPLSWFLDGEMGSSPNQQVMEKAEQALKSGDWSGGLAVLKDYRSPDPVFDGSRYFLEIAFLLELAETAIAQKKLPYARALLEKVARVGESTAYPWDRQRWLLLRFAAGENAQLLATELTAVDDRLLLLAQAALNEGEPEQAMLFLQAVRSRQPQWHLLFGQAAVAAGNYANAAEVLHGVEALFPAQCLPALEICYREMGNFEMAYRYACKIREQK